MTQSLAAGSKSSCMAKNRTHATPLARFVPDTSQRTNKNVNQVIQSSNDETRYPLGRKQAANFLSQYLRFRSKADMVRLVSGSSGWFKKSE